MASLFMQIYDSPAAAWWFPLFVAGVWFAPRPQLGTKLEWCLIAWLILLVASTFAFSPVKTAGPVFWTLAAMPMGGLVLRDKRLIPICAGIIAVYAAGLILQGIIDVRMTNGYNYSGRAWPLVNPNNAACVINCALIPALYKALRDWRFIPVTGFFTVALFITDSMAGFGAFGVATAILTVHRFGWNAVPFLMLAATMSVPLWPEAYESLTTRFPIWQATFPMLYAKTYTGIPFTGTGLGTFWFYYNSLRTEYATAGMYAHNDLLQIFAEVGLIALPVWGGIIACVVLKTTHNIPAACVLLAILLQSMVEFQFYVIPVSILAGIALSCMMKNSNNGG